MLLFFGDSLTEGTNSKHSFTDYFPYEYEIYNLGVSGTTIGEYSIYPVDGNSLLGVIKANMDLVQSADEIFIEYGSNDVSAVMCGFTTIQTVIVSFVKAIDWIKQLNPDVKIYFLAFGKNENIILNRGIRMCNYLEKDYFGKFDFKFPVSMYVSTYNKIVRHISNVCDIIYMFDDEMIKDEFMSDDNIHPNELGHIRISQNIMEQIRA